MGYGLSKRCDLHRPFCEGTRKRRQSGQGLGLIGRGRGGGRGRGFQGVGFWFCGRGEGGGLAAQPRGELCSWWFVFFGYGNVRVTEK